MNTQERDLGALDNNAVHARQQSSMLQAMMSGRPNSQASMSTDIADSKTSDGAVTMTMGNPMGKTGSMEMTKSVDKKNDKKKTEPEVKKVQITTPVKPAVTKTPTSVEALPEDWREVKDPTSGKTYFHHRKTNSTQWHRPSAESPAPAAAASELPDGWVAVQDPSSGRTYYANKTTNQTSWTLPKV
jgi:hypothetical protein